MSLLNYIPAEIFSISSRTELKWKMVLQAFWDPHFKKRNYLWVILGMLKGV